MKKLYGLNPMAPEFVPNVLRAGQPLIMTTTQNPLAFPPFYHPPPAVFPSYPPPPFQPQQWFVPGSSNRRHQPQLCPTRNQRPRVFPSEKSLNYANPPYSGPFIPHPTSHATFTEFTSSHNSPFAQSHTSLQVSGKWMYYASPPGGTCSILVVPVHFECLRFVKESHVTTEPPIPCMTATGAFILFLNVFVWIIHYFLPVIAFRLSVGVVNVFLFPFLVESRDFKIL